MARPRLTIYNEISLDGRVEGFEQDVGRYYRLGFRWRSDAILMGSVTTQAFGPAESPDEQMRVLPAPAKLPVVPGFEGLVYEPRPLLVVPDSRGSVRNWMSTMAQPWYRSIVVLVAAATPSAYLEYLGRRGVAYLSTGEDRVDLPAALEQLNTRYGVQSIRTDCGGSLNGALLAAGLVDEVTIIINPSMSANPDSQCLVKLPHSVQGAGLPLTLVELDRLNDGAVWLRYEVH
ncbi:MAG TPA: dihydrofolate reductase family protein [Propionibacteriaceae bacterium]|nr:dihydrofolate reductase family protein [Propionibacteriaceae bacterium]